MNSFVCCGNFSPMQTLQSYIKKSDAFKAFAKNRKDNILVEGLDGFPLFQCAHMMAASVSGITWLICPTEEIARVLFTNSDMVKGTSLDTLCVVADEPEQMIAEIKRLMEEDFTEDDIDERDEALKELYQNYKFLHL